MLKKSNLSLTKFLKSFIIFWSSVNPGESYKTIWPNAPLLFCPIGNSYSVNFLLYVL